MKHLALAILLAACHQHQDPVTPTNDPDGGAPEAAVSCAAYCSHAERLGCDQGKPTAKGATCTEVCSNLQTSSYSKLDLRCGYNAQTCQAMDVCEK